MTTEELIKSNVSLNETKKAVINVYYAEAVLTENFNKFLKPFDISTEQFNVLRILRGQKGVPANMFLIQDRMITKSSNTTRLIDKLLEKKCVTREVCSYNRRKIEVLITPTGLDLLKKVDPLFLEFENRFAKNLTSDEILQLNNLLEKYRTVK